MHNTLGSESLPATRIAAQGSGLRFKYLDSLDSPSHGLWRDSLTSRHHAHRHCDGCQCHGLTVTAYTLRGPAVYILSLDFKFKFGPQFRLSPVLRATDQALAVPAPDVTVTVSGPSLCSAGPAAANDSTRLPRLDPVGQSRGCQVQV